MILNHRPATEDHRDTKDSGTMLKRLERPPSFLFNLWRICEAITLGKSKGQTVYPEAAACLEGNCHPQLDGG